MLEAPVPEDVEKRDQDKEQVAIRIHVQNAMSAGRALRSHPTTNFYKMPGSLSGCSIWLG